MTDVEPDAREQALQRQGSRLKRDNRRRWLFLVAGIFVAIAALVAWLYVDHRNSESAKPLTPRQDAVLTALAHEAGSRTGKTPQAVWAEFNRRLGIRSHGDLINGQFERAESVLLDMMAVEDRR